MMHITVKYGELYQGVVYFFSLSLLWGGIRAKKLLAFFTFDAALVAQNGICFLGRLSPAGWYKQKMGGIVRGTSL